MVPEGVIRARRVFAFGALGMLALILAGYSSLLPAFREIADDNEALSGAIASALVLLTALLCWIGAVRYALALKRPGLATLLGLTGFVGGFLYYFGYVLWHSDQTAGGLTRR